MSVAALASRLAREGLGFILCDTGLLPLLSPARARRPHPLIIYYHRVLPAHAPLVGSPNLVVTQANFDRQMAQLESEFDVIPLDAMIHRLGSAAGFSAREAVVTFDDGYRDNFACAYPILRRHGLPATIFMTSGSIGGHTLPWWDRLALLLRAAREQRVPLGPERRLTRAMAAAAPEARGPFLESLERSLPNPPAASERIFLSWEEIREMSDHGITIGSHTHSHPILTRIPLAAAEEELRRSKRILEEGLGKPITAFAYPNGCLNAEVMAAVARAGYACAVQTSRYVAHHRDDRYAIPRRMVKEGHSLGPGGRYSRRAFALELSGIPARVFFRGPRRENPRSA